MRVIQCLPHFYDCDERFYHFLWPIVSSWFDRNTILVFIDRFFCTFICSVLHLSFMLSMQIKIHRVPTKDNMQIKTFTCLHFSPKNMSFRIFKEREKRFRIFFQIVDKIALWIFMKCCSYTQANLLLKYGNIASDSFEEIFYFWL